MIIIHLTIINRNMALMLLDEIEDINLMYYSFRRVIILKRRVDKKVVKKLKKLAEKDYDKQPDIQLRHAYPPIWQWPPNANTKVVLYTALGIS
jgi:hypothetical protein